MKFEKIHKALSKKG